MDEPKKIPQTPTIPGLKNPQVFTEILQEFKGILHEFCKNSQEFCRNSTRNARMRLSLDSFLFPLPRKQFLPWNLWDSGRDRSPLFVPDPCQPSHGSRELTPWEPREKQGHNSQKKKPQAEQSHKNLNPEFSWKKKKSQENQLILQE